MDPMDRRTFLRTSLGAAGALAVISCSKSSKSSKAGGTTGSTASLTSPVPRPTIRLSGAIDFGYPTPFAYFAAPGFAFMNYIYDTLLQEDTDGKMLPMLAASFDRAPDGLTYTFQMRNGAKWHDGQPVTADDVAFTYQYFKSQTLSPQLTALPTDIVDVQATGPSTVVIRLDKPAVTFESQVAGELPIIPRHIWSTIADAGKAQSPDVLVGSGPYKLAEHTVGEGTYLFNANDDYYLGRPFVKRIEFRPVSADDLSALQAGQIDEAETDVFGTPSDTLAPFRDNPQYGVSTNKAGICVPLKWNETKGGALADARFRKACAKAINLDDIVTRVAGGNGLPGNAGYLVPGNPYFTAVPQPGFDIAGANKMLDDAGYTRSSPTATRQGPDGKPLKYTLTVVSGIPAVLELVTGSLKKIGVDLTPVQVPLPNVLGGADYEMIIGFDGGITQDTDPDQLRLVFDSKSTAFQHPKGYSNPQVDQLVAQQAVTLDVAERKKILAQLQPIVADDLPVMPLYYPDQFSVFNRKVFDQWSDSGNALTEAKRNFMTGLKSGLTIRPSSG
jgi:peptide/nickel transport system substrate-binding protein